MSGCSITAVVITRNEERNLPGFLANVRQVADEVIIVDDGSTDATVQIAQTAGGYVRLISRTMGEGGFAAQRNAGIDAAKGDWILNMDCDERLSPDLVDELCATLPDTKLAAYRYRRLNYFMHRPMCYGGWASWNLPQIARRRAHRFEGRLHETCVIEGGEAMIGQMSGVMHHLNDFDLAQRFSKSAQYTAMEADRIAANGTVPVSALWWRPLREFLKKYLAQQGFRDGVPGFVAAMHSATAAFRAYALAWDRQNALSRKELEAQCTQTGRQR
ncbi:MAG: glycosyltransferase family 2 protein [Parvularcula sp.]|jgi:glycosyltransferase involved in cell wall biosynthesis|nr:glycosyltransferase family 2 protein [Parvularcula sp.]